MVNVECCVVLCMVWERGLRHATHARDLCESYELRTTTFHWLILKARLCSKATAARLHRTSYDDGTIWRIGLFSCGRAHARCRCACMSVGRVMHCWVTYWEITCTDFAVARNFGMRSENESTLCASDSVRFMHRGIRTWCIALVHLCNAWYGMTGDCLRKCVQ